MLHGSTGHCCGRQTIYILNCMVAFVIDQVASTLVEHWLRFSLSWICALDMVESQQEGFQLVLATICQPCLVCRKWSSCVDRWYMSGGILSQVLTAAWQCAWQSWGQVIHCDSGDWIATYFLTNYWHHSNNHCSYSQVYSFMTAIKKWMLHTDLRP